MSQRNPMNERYSDDKRKGKTRKSAASAKPSSNRAATVREPAPKSKKQKKAEAREREQKREQQVRAMTPDMKRFEDTPEYKKLRRFWWGFIIGAIALIVISFVSSRYESMQFLYIPCLIAGYLLVIAAFYIDLGKIRKMRKAYAATLVTGKSKEARAAQKKARAEARAQQKEAEEKLEEAKTAEAEKKESGFLARFRKQSPTTEDSASDSTDQEEPSS